MNTPPHGALRGSAGEGDTILPSPPVPVFTTRSLEDALLEERRRRENAEFLLRQAHAAMQTVELALLADPATDSFARDLAKMLRDARGAK